MKVFMLVGGLVSIFFTMPILAFAKDRACTYDEKQQIMKGWEEVSLFSALVMGENDANGTLYKKTGDSYIGMECTVMDCDVRGAKEACHV